MPTTGHRVATARRATKETSIEVSIDLDGTGAGELKDLAEPGDALAGANLAYFVSMQPLSDWSAVRCDSVSAPYVWAIAVVAIGIVVMFSTLGTLNGSMLT